MQYFETVEERDDKKQISSISKKAIILVKPSVQRK